MHQSVETFMHDRLVAFRQPQKCRVTTLWFANPHLGARMLTCTSLPTLATYLYLLPSYSSRSHHHSWLVRTSCIAMSTSSNPPKLLLPFGFVMAPPELPPLSANTAPQPRRKPKAPTKTRQQWEAQRTNIHQLYIDEDLPLADVMKAMEDNHDFRASYVASFPACLA